MNKACRLAGLLVLLCAVGGADVTFVNDLLPRPQELEMNQGVLALDQPGWRVTLTGPSDESIARLRARLSESLERAGIIVSIETEKDGICSVSLSLTREVPFAVPPLDAPGDRIDQAYSLVVAESGVAVQAFRETGLFYGMMTVEQLLCSARARGASQLPCLQITDWPALPMRGFSEDYGRDQLPTIEEHKRAIRNLARFKMNTYLWFIEPDHFVYQFDPGISAEYDRFHFDEIRELVAYAKEYYIEVIPTVELLGHMEMTLRHEKYRGLAEMPEGGGDLCPTSDEAFELVRQMVGEIAPAFGAKYFHCGLDESYAVGKGRSAAAVAEKGIERVFADYYTRMNDLVKSHGATMMMYADIVLNHPDMLPMLPKDIVMMFWDYSPKQEYPGLTALKDSGMQVTALSGLWSWCNLYPLYPAGFANMETLAAQAARDGALGHFVSSWGDGFKGAAGFNLSEADFYGVAYCCAVSWKPEPIPMAQYSRDFSAHFFGSANSDLADALTRLAQCQGDDLSRHTQARRMFHTDAVETVWAMSRLAPASLAFWRKLREDAEAVVTTLDAVDAPLNSDYLRATALLARMLHCAADMALEGYVLATELEKPDLDRAQHAEKYEALATRHQQLWDEYRAVWLATNRPLNMNHIDKVWAPAIESMRTLAAELRSGAFPPPMAQGVKAAFGFDGEGDAAWTDETGLGLRLVPVDGVPAPELRQGGPSGEGQYIALAHGARCEVLDESRAMDFRTGPFLVEAWVRHSGQPEQQYGSTIFSYGLDGGWRLGINHKGEVLFTLYGIGEQAGTRSILPPDNAWHHVAVSFHHCGTVEYYVDGLLTDQLELSGYPRSPGTPLVRVGNEIGLVTPFAGDIDRIRVSAGLFGPEELDAKP